MPAVGVGGCSAETSSVRQVAGQQPVSMLALGDPSGPRETPVPKARI